MGITLRREVTKAKHEKLPDRVGMTASGSPEMFSDEIMDRLAMAGFVKVRARKDSYQQVWRLPSTVGAIPTHLLKSLSRVSKITGDPALERLLMLATQAGEGTKAGGAALRIRTLGAYFCANCDQEDDARRAFLEGAGLFPLLQRGQACPDAILNAFGSRPYVTMDGVIAANVQPWMDAKTSDALIARMGEEILNVKRSKVRQRIKGDPVIPIAEGEALQGFQDAGVNNLLRTRKSGVIYDDMGLGKAQPLDSNILSPFGWMKMGEVRVGDSVIGSDGRPTEVIGVYPQGKREVFRVRFSDGAETRCCDEHLWKVSWREGRQMLTSVLSLAEIREGLRGGKRYEVPLMTAPDFSECEFHYPDADLIEMWLSGQAPTPHFMRAPLKRRRNALRLLISRLDPEDVSINTCLTVRLKGQRSDKFCREFLVDLVRSLGGTAKDHGHLIEISLPNATNPFRDPERASAYAQTVRNGPPRRRIESVRADGHEETQCIAVSAPDHLYVTDDYVVTHNTVQGIAYANARPDLPRILVVCKANMKIGWKTSFERFGVRPQNAFVISGASATITDPKTGEVFPATPPPETLVPAGRPVTPETQDMVSLVIINYDILTHHEEFIRNTVWDLVILDEIHSVSNEEAQRTQILFGDIKDFHKKPVTIKTSKEGVKIGLSGTPHPVVERMWPILSSLRPDVFGTGPEAKRLFMNRYAPKTLFVKTFKRGNKSSEKILAIPGKPIRQAELNRRLRASGFMTRRLKADMKDFLPPKSRAAIELPFTLSPQDIRELSDIDGKIADVAASVQGRAGERIATMKGVERAHAIIDVVHGMHPRSPEFHEISRLRARIGEIKAPYVARYVIDEMEGEDDLPLEIRPKTVIFAHHKAVVAEIGAALEKAYPKQVLIYDGSVTSDKKRFEMEKRFQEDDDIRFFLMSLSGASGITLTRANRLYMAEMDWDPTNLPQIEDRIWRMTQELPCLIGYFMIPNSMDTQMGNKIIQKMVDNRLIYDEIDLRPGVKKKNAFRKVSEPVDDRQGKLAL